MLATLALTAMTLAPSQGALTTKNISLRPSLVSPVRKSGKFLPGELVWLTFDVGGFKVADNGKIEYSIGYEVTRKGKTKPEVKRDAQDYVGFAHLGGDSLPMFAFWPSKADTPAGDYTLKVTIADKKSKASATVTRSFEILKKQFGFIQTYVTPVAPVGDNVSVLCAISGFEVSKKDKTPHIQVTIKVLDAKGKETVTKAPFKEEIKTENKDMPGTIYLNPQFFRLQLNRAGKYQVVIEATDKIGGKTIKETLDINVVTP